MTAKITADADGTKVLIGNAAENALEIDSAAKTIKALAPYLFNADNGVPVGTIIDFAGANPPAGYLACPLVDTPVSRATYAALFAAIGTTWGAGDGSTTFSIPWFPADTVAVMSNGNVGTQTTGVVKSHVHEVYQAAWQNATGPGSVWTGQGSTSPSNNNTGGGPNNLPAGARVRKCVKY
jgi:microcystin-dependent protein